MQSRRVAPFLLVPLVAGLVACSSDGGSKDKNTSSAPAGTSAAAPTNPEAAALTTKLRTGIGSLRSAHFVLSGTLAGAPLTGSGDQKLSDGKADALQAEAILPGGLGAVSIVVTDGKAYAKLPPNLGDAKKPWVVISSTSTNIVVQKVSGFVDAALAAASVGKLGDLTSAATKVENKGAASVGAIKTTHYLLVVDPTRLPGGLADPEVLGTKTISIDLYLDATNRPVQVRAQLSVSDQAADISIVFSKFDAPVTVSPPPADQIATD